MIDRLSSLLDRYSDVFSNKELGTLQGFKAKSFIDSHTCPFFCKARPAPYIVFVCKSICKSTNCYLRTFSEPVPFSDWAAPIVPIMKPDKFIRICGDFKQTNNKVSKLERYPIPKINDLFATLSGGTSFSKLDLSQAYQQLVLDDESKHYTVLYLVIY